MQRMEQNETPQPPLPDTRRNWLVWIISTTMLPAVAGACGAMNSNTGTMLASWLVLISLVLHNEVCGKLAPPKSWMYFFLMFGGGALLFSFLFSGCLIGNVSQSH
jgi:hypothetical protein